MDIRGIVRAAGMAAVAWVVVSAFAAESSFGTFTDARDGQTYKTVKIGGQTWLAENLNFQTDSGSSWCYKNSVDSCKKYGGLYHWYAAATVCPDGWKLPDTADWNSLEKAVGSSEAGKKLKAKNGWNNNGDGTNDYGFSASPGGYRTSGGDFGGVGDRGR